jgi:hypothetical protein
MCLKSLKRTKISAQYADLIAVPSHIKIIDVNVFCSAGQPDVDCVGDALCCFDGCANVCVGGGESTIHL